eukprot:Phypoly_transcript_14915.p1 GENE.Phypoly_transcript_14915~~Phypoly_transcript_14915.p1  ORF type:complete len:238 (+),score=30.89 Phypoly_transcript_14915:241-954(+)
MPTTNDLHLTLADAKALEERVAGIRVVREFITQEEERKLLAAIDAQEWNTDIKRRTQQYGAKYDYRTQNASHKENEKREVAPIPDSFEFVTQRLLQQNIYTDEHPPDQLIINEYTKGQGILHHIDAPKLWGPIVSTLSIGSPAVMEFRKPKKEDPTGKHTVDIILEPRSIVVLTGPARYDWQHGIAKTVSFNWKGVKYTRPDDYRRISLTFRTIATRQDNKRDEAEESPRTHKKIKT